MQIQKQFNKQNSLDKQKIGPDDNAADAGNQQSMFVLTILEKTKETRLAFPQGSVTVL